MRAISMHAACLLALSAVGLAVLAADPSPSTAKLGKKIDNITFKGSDGKAVALHDFKDSKAVVVVFLSFDCPVCTGYCPTLTELANDYAAKGVKFIGVCACDEDTATIEKHAKEFKLPFPVYRDTTAAEALKADVTPEAFVLSGDHLTLNYRGRIDDTYIARLKPKAQTTKHDLKAALDQILAGKAVSEPATVAVGCPIARMPKTVTDTAVTYYRDVLPILQNNCQQCHRPGEAGPFSLMSYKQAVNWASDIKETTHKRQMPPWKPSDGPAYRDERKMSDKDIATLAAWVDGGTPEGDAKDAPAPRKFTEGWQLGKPDLILTVDDDFQLGASGRDLFRCFVLPTNTDEDKYVTAVEVRPGNPRVVHHALTFLDTQGRGRKLAQDEKDRKKKDEEKDRGPGYSVQMGVGFAPSGALSGWAPGQVTRRLPEDTGYYLPKGCDVVIQIHYHRNGRDEKDRTQIGLYLAPKPVAKRFQSLVLPGRFLFIAPGVEDQVIKGSLWVDQDCDVHSIMPHMHMLGKEIKVTVTPPEGKAQTLVAIKEWDYNWQETYFFKEAIAVKTGTRFDVEAHYDNSAKNPRNPNSPPKFVKFGEQTNDEMCFVFMGATSDKAGRIKVRREAPK